MDIKITKKRLANVLNYEWIVSIVLAVGAVFLWVLIYTMTETRLTTGQQFYLVKYEGVKTKSSDSDYDFLNVLATSGGKDGKGVLSYDVYTVSKTDIQSAGQYSAYYMLDIRLSTYEGDVIVIGGGDKEYVEGEETDLFKLAQYGRLSTIDGLLEGAREYTIGKGFVSESGELQEGKIEDYFRNVRIKSARNYRRTYTTEEKIQEGVKQEIERIRAIYENYVAVSSAIKKAKENGEDFLWYTALPKEDGFSEEMAFGIDLAKLKGYTLDSGIWYLNDENGNATLNGLVFAVFRENDQYDLQYESLAVLEYIIRTYGGDAQR